jgi:hypothetical protein
MNGSIAMEEKIIKAYFISNGTAITVETLGLNFRVFTLKRELFRL